MNPGEPTSRHPTAPGWLTEDLRTLLERIQPFGLKAPNDVPTKLHRYCLELLAWNRRHGLLSHGDLQFIVTKHIAASLGVYLGVDPTPNSRWVDIGTGAGFPGLVLKIWSPSLEISLVESAHKRCVFLQHVMQILDVSNVPLYQARVETLVARGELVGTFDVLLSRAVTDLVGTLREFGPLVRAGGKIVTFKGPRWGDEIMEAHEQGLIDPGPYALEQSFCVPWTTAHILVLRKS